MANEIEKTEKMTTEVEEAPAPKTPKTPKDPVREKIMDQGFAPKGYMSKKQKNALDNKTWNRYKNLQGNAKKDFYGNINKFHDPQWNGMTKRKNKYIGEISYDDPKINDVDIENQIWKAIDEKGLTEEQAEKLFDEYPAEEYEPEYGEPGYSWKREVLKKPELIDGDVLALEESDPEKYKNNPKALREDLYKQMISGEGDNDFTPEEANQVLDAWLGPEDRNKKADGSWREGRKPLYTEDDWQDEQDESDQGQGDPTERMYVLRHMKEWMNEADNGPIDEDLMMEAYYQADEENGFDDTMSADEVWETVASKYDELMEAKEREKASELFGTDLNKKA